MRTRFTALATDIDGHTTLSAPVTVNVANGSYFQNEILATGFNLPTAIKFLPDGRMLVVELAGTIKVLPPPYTTPNPTPFLQLTNIGSAGVQQGIYDIALDPNFSTNHYYYIFYTLGTPNVDRFSRFTANATLTGTVAGSEFVIYQDTEIANAEHHGGAINFSNDGKILLTTGEHFNAGEAQDLTKPRGKILRFNMDGTIPTDNPFYDGAGPNYDAIWALGLRNPLPRLLRRANRASHHRRRGRQRLFDRDRRNRHRREGRQLRLAERRSAQRQSRLYGPGLLLSAQWTRRGDHVAGSSITERSFPAATREASSSPITRKIGSSA